MAAELLRDELYRITGMDLTSIDGINGLTAQTLIAEVGFDMSRWERRGISILQKGLRFAHPPHSPPTERMRLTGIAHSCVPRPDSSRCPERTHPPAARRGLCRQRRARQGSPSPSGRLATGGQPERQCSVRHCSPRV